MTPLDFRHWRARLGFSQADAASALGVHISTVKNYERGRLASGKHAPIPRLVALATVAAEALQAARLGPPPYALAPPDADTIDAQELQPQQPRWKRA